MIGILENIRATLKMGRGLFRINSMWGRVYLRKGKIGRASLEENLEKGGLLIENEKG